MTDDLKNLAKKSRQLAIPSQTLCLIELDNGESENYYLPDQILHDEKVNKPDWWNENYKDRYIPLMQGKTKAVRVTAILEQ